MESSRSARIIADKLFKESRRGSAAHHLLRLVVVERRRKRRRRCGRTGGQRHSPKPSARCRRVHVQFPGVAGCTGRGPALPLPPPVDRGLVVAREGTHLHQLPVGPLEGPHSQVNPNSFELAKSCLETSHAEYVD